MDRLEKNIDATPGNEFGQSLANVGDEFLDRLDFRVASMQPAKLVFSLVGPDIFRVAIVGQLPVPSVAPSLSHDPLIPVRLP